MNYDYINERAKAEGTDPREDLQKFVTNNISHLRENFFEKVAPDLEANNNQERLEEYVKTNNPYKVLENCFSPVMLVNLAIQQLGINLQSEAQGRELIGEMLEELGFIKEVKPTGLSQIRRSLELDLNQAAGNTLLDLKDIDGILAEIARKMEELLIKLFLFHSGALRSKLEESTETDFEKLSKLDKLSADYQTQKKQMGHYVLFLNNLMKIFQNDEAPLTEHQISEIGLFTVYRNLTLKNPDEGFWEQNELHAKICLEKINDASNEWKGGWEAIVDAWTQKRPFPKREMLQKMAVFFQTFLNVLSEDQIYPKVIVMQHYTYDNYGTHQIYAIDDADEVVRFTNAKFIPFTEFYYHSHTNPVGIDPILVSKEELEDWAT